MRKFRAIIQSFKEPEDKEVFWLFKGRLLYYNNGQWIAVPLISQSAIDAANRANAAADKAELATIGANEALENAKDALEKATEFSEQLPKIQNVLGSLPETIVHKVTSRNLGTGDNEKTVISHSTYYKQKNGDYAGGNSQFVQLLCAKSNQAGLMSTKSKKLVDSWESFLSQVSPLNIVTRIEDGQGDKDKVTIKYWETSNPNSDTWNATIISDLFNIPKVTTSSAGVMSAEDKTKLENHQTLIDHANGPGGILMLDDNGLVPSNQLPSYVDDVLEFDSKTDFPSTGETGKIYLAINTNLPYRWSGSTYVEIAGGLTLGETSTTAFAGNRGKKLEEDMTEQQQTLDSVMGIMNKQYYAVSISSNPNISVIEKGVVQSLQISWSSTFDGAPTTSTFVVRKNNEVVDVPSNATSFNTEISDTTTFNVAGTRNGVTKTASKTINAYYPKYYGGSGKTTLTGEDVITFPKQAISGSASGTYTITSGDDEYIWFNIPSNMTINKVTLGGFNVPLAAPIIVSVPGKMDYKCYRTANPLSAGTRQFVIS